VSLYFFRALHRRTPFQVLATFSGRSPHIWRSLSAIQVFALLRRGPQHRCSKVLCRCSIPQSSSTTAAIAAGAEHARTDLMVVLREVS
jgi:hypothetical protein